MKNLSEPIIFFGSGPVAAASLQSLVNNFSIAAVITKPAPTHYRGEVPVLSLAKSLGLQVYLVQDKTDLLSLFAKDVLAKVRLGVLVDFGIIVPQPVISYFPLGIINSHFSLLPEWRGADPITFAILSGQKETGVSLMLLVERMDEGPLLAQGHLKLSPTITGPALTDQLIHLSNTMLTQHIPLYLHNKIQPLPQDKSRVPTYSRKLTKQDGVIDWSKPATEIEREIRAFNSWPRSHTTINNTEVIISKAHVANIQLEPGSTRKNDKDLLVGCLRQSLVIDRIKPSGKKEMSGSDFLLGYPINPS